MSITLFTIGFTQTSAEHFFTRLQAAGVRRVVDVRLNNISQLAGFSKRNDLQYFLHVINHMNYVHYPEMAPTQVMLDAYKKGNMSWDSYASQFLALLGARQIETGFEPAAFDGNCLLCSEATAAKCHRRLVAEYLQAHWRDMKIVHL